MAKFRDIQKGVRARRTVEMPLAGTTVRLDVRVLGPDDDIAIAVEAAKLARSKGVDEPAPGGEVYDGAETLFTLLRACVDTESPEEQPEPFFASLDELLPPDAAAAQKNPLTREHLAFLREQQARWQDECSPRRRELDAGEYVAHVALAAEGDPRPFVALGPAMQWAFARTMARELVISRTAKSPPTSQTSASGQPS
jgi:hypothetical protein